LDSRAFSRGAKDGIRGDFEGQHFAHRQITITGSPRAGPAVHGGEIVAKFLDISAENKTASVQVTPRGVEKNGRD
jgi:hypothetical protein